MNIALLKEPVNWLIVWSMLVIGLFLFHLAKTALPSANSN